MKIKFIAFALLSGASLFAQQATFKWASLQDIKKEGLQNPAIVLPTNSGFYTYSYETAISPILPNNMFVSKFNADAVLQDTQKFELPKRNRREATLKTVIEAANNKKMFFVSELALGKDNANILYIQAFDPETNKVNPEVELQKITFEKTSNSGIFSVAQSADKTKVAVLLNYPEVKDSKEKIKAIVYDDSFNKLWEKEYTLEHPSDRSYTEQLFVTNKGAIVLTKVEDENKKEPKIYVLQISDAAVKEKLISEPAFFPSNYKIAESDKGETYLTGYFTDNWKPTISMGGRKEKGAFAYNITAEKTTSKNLWTDAVVKEYNSAIVGLQLLDTFITNNEIYLVGDVKSVKEVMDKNSAKFESNFTYTTGPGIVAKIKADGSLISNVFRYKELQYVNKMGRATSFSSLMFDNKLLLLGNDSEASLKGKKIVAGAAVGYKTVVLSPFNDDGTITANPQWESGTGGKDSATILATTFTRRVDNNTYYVYSVGSDYQAFGKMTIK